jgi:hypothetical protein
VAGRPCACCPRPIEDDGTGRIPLHERVLCNTCRARYESAAVGGGGDVVSTRGIGSTWVVGNSA